jgi:hypothetical protein
VVQVRVHGSPLLRFHTLTTTDPDPCNILLSRISTARVFFFTTALLSGGEKKNTLSQIFKDRRQKQGKKKKKKKDTLRKPEMKPCRGRHTRELEERQEHSDSRIATK